MQTTDPVRRSRQFTLVVKWSSWHYFLNDWTIGGRGPNPSNERRPAGNTAAARALPQVTATRTAQHQVYVHLLITIDLAVGMHLKTAARSSAKPKAVRYRILQPKYRVTEKEGMELLKEDKATLGSGSIPYVCVQCVRIGVSGRDDS